MKKVLIMLLSIISFNCVFIKTLDAQENALNNIIGAEGQFSQTNFELIQQKINDLSKNLNLTEEQKQKTEEIGKTSAKKLNIYKVKFIEEKNKLIVLRKSNAPIIQIQTQVKTVQSTKSRLNLIRKKSMQEFEAILTSEQKTCFDQFKIDLQQIKQTETHFNREIQENKTRENFLKDLENPDN